MTSVGGRYQMTAEEIAKVAYNTNLQLIEQEAKAGIGNTEDEVMLIPWEDTPLWVRELYQQYVRLMMKQPETALAHQVQDLWIKDQMSRGWKYGKEFSKEKMTNPYLIPSRQWNENERNRYFITFGMCQRFRRFYVEEPEVYTETVQEGVENGSENYKQ